MAKTYKSFMGKGDALRSSTFAVVASARSIAEKKGNLGSPGAGIIQDEKRDNKSDGRCS